VILIYLLVLLCWVAVAWVIIWYQEKKRRDKREDIKRRVRYYRR